MNIVVLGSGGRQDTALLLFCPTSQRTERWRGQARGCRCL